MKWCTLLLGAVLISPPSAALAQTEDPFDFSLGELMSVEVISVARKRQEIGSVPAAVHVVTEEDIARMGVTTLPDALRLVPGVQVAAIGNNRWAVSVRGFNSRFANSLLVMVDGRTVYSPLFSGTYWEMLDIPLAEIDRIEVIRGPGAAVWGANAVNGIVNIITKWARATQGGEARLTVGNVDRAQAYLRHGGKLDDGHYRLSYHGRARETSRLLNGADGRDAWYTNRLGLRMERFLGGVGELRVSGEVFGNRSEDLWLSPDSTSPTLATPVAFTQRDQGVGLTVQLNRALGKDREWSVQGSYQYLDSKVGPFLAETRSTFDLDAQYRFTAGAHELIVGSGMRYNDQKVLAGGFFEIDTPRRQFGLLSAFVHDEITLVPDRLRLTGGVKFEHHSWTGNEWQPSLGLAWQVAPRHLIWGSVSEASRTPARTEFDMTYAPSTQAGALIRFRPPENLRAERMRAYELGYRAQPSDRVSVDVTAFLMRYRHLRTLRTMGVAPDDARKWIVVDAPLEFAGHGTVSGFEASVDWQPLVSWRARFSYSHLDTRIEARGDPLGDAASSFYMERIPSDQLNAHVTWKPKSGHAVDMIVRHVSDLIYSESGGGIEPVKGYTELDLQYGWRASKRLTLAVVGRNLMNARHAEFGRLYMPSPMREIGRSVHLTAQWDFD